jgi:hypothetical protein
LGFEFEEGLHIPQKITKENLTSMLIIAENTMTDSAIEINEVNKQTNSK